MDDEVDGKLVHTNNYETYSYKMWYRLAKGIVQVKMNYTYTMEEVMQHTEEWMKKKKDEKV